MVSKIEMDICFELHSLDNSVQIMSKRNATDFVQNYFSFFEKYLESNKAQESFFTLQCTVKRNKCRRGSCWDQYYKKVILAIWKVLDSLHLAYSTLLPLLTLHSRFWESHLKLYNKDSDESVIVQCPEALFSLLGA